jgi:predicted phosphate transport protein (TIGR00153 family)
LDLAEDVADLSLRTMIDSLKKAPYLPSTKEDLISIATSCDKIANKCETVANRIVLRRIPCPAIYVDDILKIFAVTKKQFQMLEDCISMLFSQLNVLSSEPQHLDQIRALESEVDKLEHGIYEHLYASDRELAEKQQIARVVELLCDVSDIIEDIADKIQIMLITRMA